MALTWRSAALFAVTACLDTTTPAHPCCRGVRGCPEHLLAGACVFAQSTYFTCCHLQTGFETKYLQRRQHARQTWFPHNTEEQARCARMPLAAAAHLTRNDWCPQTLTTGVTWCALRLHEETGMVLRFAIGDVPAELEQDIQQEEEASGPFLRIPGKVGATGASRWAQVVQTPLLGVLCRANKALFLSLCKVGFLLGAKGMATLLIELVAAGHIQVAYLQDRGVLGGGVAAVQRAVRCQGRRRQLRAPGPACHRPWAVAGHGSWCILPQILPLRLTERACYAYDAPFGRTTAILEQQPLRLGAAHIFRSFSVRQGKMHLASSSALARTCRVHRLLQGQGQ